MAKLKLGAIRTLAHERLVSVEVVKNVHVLGYAFASGGVDGILVCLRKLEMEAAGLSCAGPCINRFYSSTKVTFLDSSKLPVVEEEKDEDEDELGDNSDSSDDTNSGGDLLEEPNHKKKERKKRKVKGK